MATTTSESAVAPLTIALFGPMRVLVHGQQLPHLRSRKAKWLLALLVLRHKYPVDRVWLARTLWPDLDQNQAFANLRPVLSELRKALGSESERLRSPDRHTLSLDLQGADVDVFVFDAAIVSKQHAALERAVSAYVGPVLEGCTEEWVGQERSAREQDCLQALQILADTALTTGDYSAAIGYYQRAVGMDPWCEAGQRGLMKVFALAGDDNAALQVYRNFTELLRSDPGAVPDEETSALYRRLRSSARQRARAQSEVTVNEAATPIISGYLPHFPTSLVGREDERAQVIMRLRRYRLVTLTGSGGIGKTRLATGVAAEVVKEYADGVWFVALESLTEGRLVIQQIAAVLGVREEAGQSLPERLIGHLRTKRMLLVLDNCEHLLEACADVVRRLLRECTWVRILTTSREALGITGEAAWRVPSLPVPDPVHLPKEHTTLLRVLPGYESVQLFVERAQACQQDFALARSNAMAVAQVCARLQGIPLAIEMAAARVRALSVEEIAARLDDHLSLLTRGSRASLPRQQTLRAMLDWSYALLNESEQLLLGRLSSFAGGWSLDAATKVCAGNSIEVWQIPGLLASLVDKSLVVFEEREREGSGRYRLLEMVRQYAAERLQASGQADQVKARHRNYFLALAEEAEPELMGANQGVWLERLETERANLRGALDWCRAEDGAKAGLQLASALYRFWEMHGHCSEGRAHLAAALARDGANERTNERARALNGAGVLSGYQGDYQAARTLLEEGLAIFRELGNQQGVGWSLNDLGDVVGAQGDRAAARVLYEESLAIFRKLGNQQGIASLLHHLGGIVREEGDYEDAQKLYEESLAIFRELGNRQRAAWSLHHLGNVNRVRGNYQAARALQEESLAIFRELGNQQGAGWSLKELGDVAGAQGDHAAARAQYEESLAIFRELGVRQGIASLLHHLGGIVREEGDYEDAQKLYEESLAIFRELGNRQGVGWALNGLGRVTLDQGHSALAQTLYAEGISILQELGDKKGVAEGLEGLAAVSEAKKAMC